MPARLLLTALTATAALLLAACQSTTVTPFAEQEDPLASAPAIERGLDADGLAALMTAEFAGQRGDYRTASQGYLAMAERYQSVALIERAALAARFSDDPTLFETTARRWRELAPEAEAPARLLSGLAMQRGDWQDGLEQRLALAQRGGHAELTNFVEQAIDEGANLPPLLELLHEHLEIVDTSRAQHHDAVLATALLEAATGQSARAQARLDTLDDSHAELPELWLTRARLALDRGDAAAARRASQRGIDVSPDDGRFILMLAQSELMLGNIEAAEAQTDILLERHAASNDLRLALAQLYLDETHPEPARRLLLPLVSGDDTPALAFTLLGAIAEEEGEIDNALLYYRQVPPGEHFLQARLFAARMLMDDERLPDARSFLRIERLRHDEQAASLAALEVELLDQRGLDAEADELLEQQLRETPDSDELLYLRAMRAFNDGDLAAMERDLQRIIDNDPNHAMALNALGYTLVDLTDRTEEGMALVERAYRLAPDNPAILDSMGWGYHRLGDDERALPYLERAYANMPDQEIAAHLAEVLWELGREDEARELIREAHARFEERPVVDELLERRPEMSPEH
ncbi:Tetratricopeptide repeat-containing protein [Franzmannia pantelleriensis]|uniref:Tetratricopeptide repeat-containing protein n=1 Tax=Franzmannia pantelleriensis TaxID=48727 RepID=A0A1G9NDY1_9GAMM|nr:tetratricopeptide repeat protein [Halomonas pantelleriensis]SDL84670.1 Tetratricopeptide repeat-containing protein [Halomonas pantelleriensis]